MEQLAILEKICNNLFDSLECGTATYIFAAAIYDTWSSSYNKLEENLAKGLIPLWEAELTQRMYDSYRKLAYEENCCEKDTYYKKWIESNYKAYSDNKGIQCALANIWEKNYGFRHWTNN